MKTFLVLLQFAMDPDAPLKRGERGRMRQERKQYARSTKKALAIDILVPFIETQRDCDRRHQ